MTVAIASSVGMAIHPCFEKLYAGESGQAPDRLVDLADRDPPVLTIEEVLRHELELARRADAGRAPKPLLGLTIIKEEVARFIAHDPLEQLVEHGVPGDRPEPQISGQR